MNRPVIYSKYNALQLGDNKFTLDKYLKLIQWKKKPKILDIGCGDGKSTLKVLEPRVPRDYSKLVLSDLQESMVEYAKKSNKNNRLEFVQFDIAGEKLLPEKYDHIFSFFTFHWVANLRKGFKNVYDMLNPGGDMLINLGWDHPFLGLAEKLWTNSEWNSYFDNKMLPPLYSCQNPEKILQMHLEENGFINIKIYVEARSFSYNNFASYCKSFLSVDPILSKLNEEQKQEYIVDFVCTLKHVYGENEEANGEITVPNKILVVYASKPE